MPTDPARVQVVFSATVAILDRDARTAFLAGACDGEPELQARVEALLRALEQPDSLLDAPPDAGNAATRAFTPTLDATAPAGTEDEPITFLAPSTRPDSLGRIGHYEVLRVLGKGGFGIVFRAFDDILQRVVAIKVMAPQMAATSPARKRFLREARSSAQVRHENVVQVYEVVEQPLPYLVMEFIPGETLQQLLNRTGPLAVSEVLRIGRQIAEGLAAAHATDLIHRDIKPANILIEGGSQRKVKITDFGLARAADDASISQSGIIAGTPMFMAPEQALGQQLDQRADLFSLGSVLYQMTAGRPPFRANSTVAVLKRVAEDTPRPIREIIPETPQWLCDIITRLHAKNPDDRYQSAREVADVLADCEAQLKGGSKLKDFSRIPQRALPTVGFGKRVIVSSFIVLCLVGLVAIVAGLYFNRPESKPKDDSASAVPVPPTPPIQVVTQGPPFKNSLGMEFVKVPKGKSWLGGAANQRGDTQVVIEQDFYLGKYEVTQAEWEGFKGLNKSAFQRNGASKDAVMDIPDADLIRFPVEQVSWEECQLFIERLNKQEKESGWKYRFPTTAEWEYACRGGPTDKLDSAFDYYFAKPTDRLLPDQANYDTKTDKALKRPCKVGSYPPNSLGLHDMHGNVHEWCEETELVVDGASRRVGRGGSWSSAVGHCRASSRYADPASSRSFNLGLRLARVPSGVPSPEAKMPPVAVAPFTDADVQRIAALPAAEQVEEVRKELMKRNPEFDGQVGHKIEGGVVTEFRIVTDKVADIAAVRALTGLVYLDLRGTYPNKGKLADLSPLKGMRLSRLDCSSTQIANLAPLTDVPLTTLHVNHNPVADLTPLKGMPLEHLGIAETKVSDLSPLKGLKLQTLGAQLLPVTDLSPLEGMPLTGLDLYHTIGVTKLDALKGMPLEGLNVQDVPVKDLAPLKDMSTLRSLQLMATDVSDLSPLAGLKLTDLILGGNQITDLSPLKGLPLKRLHFSGTGVSDLRPLQGMSLDDIRLNPKNINQGLDVLRGMKSLKTIGTEGNKVWPAAEFWERYDKGEFKE